MEAGKLDTLITLLARTSVRTDFGEEHESYTEGPRVWAQLRPLAASERFAAFADHSAKMNYFRIRYRSDVTPLMRIRYDGNDWEIRGITEIGRHEALDILAEVRF